MSNSYIFAYGIDLAENLNYFASICMKVTPNKAFLHDIVKLKDTNYPTLQNILLNDQFERFPPKRKSIYIDYTNEKSFSESLETKLNPAFANLFHEDYNEWKWIEPYKFNSSSKLALKQNAKEVMENRMFTWPQGGAYEPEKNDLLNELYEQILRESGEPGRGDNAPMRFPKPEGYDNDLVVAFELALMAARRFINRFSGGVRRTEPDGSPMSAGITIEEYYGETETPQQSAENRARKIAEQLGFGFEVTDIQADVPED